MLLLDITSRILENYTLSLFEWNKYAFHTAQMRGLWHLSALLLLRNNGELKVSQAIVVV